MNLERALASQRERVIAGLRELRRRQRSLRILLAFTLSIGVVVGGFAVVSARRSRARTLGAASASIAFLSSGLAWRRMRMLGSELDVLGATARSYV